MWICKAVFALAVVLFTVKAQELEETEGKKINTNCERSELPSILVKIHYQKLRKIGVIFIKNQDL